MRSKENADDFSGTADVLIEVVENYYTQNLRFEYACCIYPTAPLISLGKIEKGYEQIVANKNDTVFPIVAFSYSVWRGLKLESNGKTSMVWPEYVNARSQDLEDIFHDAGQWYWINIDSLKRTKKLFTNNTSAIVLNQIEVQDIDIVASSGHKAFDAICVEDIWSASPFPPLPDQLGKTVARFEVRSYI